MNVATATTHLANLSDATTRVELSDWAVNTLRAAARAGELRKGFGAATVADLPALLGQELARITAAGIALDATGLLPYLRVRRAGSAFRLDRRQRVVIFAALASKLARA